MTGSFSEAEKAAMRERAEELREEKRPAKGAAKRARERAAVVDAIAAMPEPDRVLAQQLHDLIIAAHPNLDPRTWYGMPAYSLNGQVICFIQVGSKFDSRYTTIGFNDGARLDEGTMWPTSFAITAIGESEAKAITQLVRQACAGDAPSEVGSRKS